jgi:hypothetical protein
MKIEMKPVVHSYNIEKELGINVLDCEFTQMVANDSYVILWLDDDRVNDLQEEIADCNDGSEDKYVKRLENELDLINRFRAMGYTDSILVFVSW